ncbi:hypothetical protein V6N11_057044 [Hibiscus sabdariffa]|uniref:Uncharacterized protein n=1 Tax=Hibiscus sabdariffa TaxID=183260 RepID=A0ABR1ZC47_9ROSI
MLNSTSPDLYDFPVPTPRATAIEWNAVPSSWNLRCIPLGAKGADSDSSIVFSICKLRDWHCYGRCLNTNSATERHATSSPMAMRTCNSFSMQFPATQYIGLTEVLGGSMASSVLHWSGAKESGKSTVKYPWTKYQTAEVS